MYYLLSHELYICRFLPACLTRVSGTENKWKKFSSFLPAQSMSRYLNNAAWCNDSHANTLSPEAIAFNSCILDRKWNSARCGGRGSVEKFRHVSPASSYALQHPRKQPEHINVMKKFSFQLFFYCCITLEGDKKVYSWSFFIVARSLLYLLVIVRGGGM